MSGLTNKVVSIMGAVVLFCAGLASATPIAYDGELKNGEMNKGAVSSSGKYTTKSSDSSDYWSFNATGQVQFSSFMLLRQRSQKSTLEQYFTRKERIKLLEN